MKTLIGNNWREKWAQEQDVEKSFLDLAYNEIQRKASPLMRPQFRLGFEIVEKNENNTRLVGIFAFRVHGSLYYAPVFYLNGQLKGTDLFYSHSTKSFIPLQERWLDYIINSQQQDLGVGTDASKERGWKAGPNFFQLIFPPGRHKVAEVAATIDELDKAPSAKSAWLEMQLIMEAAKEAAEEQKLLLPDYLREHGGLPALSRIVEWMQDKKFAQALAKTYPNQEYLVPGLKQAAEVAQPANDKGTVTVVTAKRDCSRPYEVGEADKFKLITQKYTIIDKRDNDQTARVFNISYGKHFVSPNENGVYRVLSRGGFLTPCFVSTTPQHLGNDNCKLVMLVPLGTEKVTPVLADQKTVFAEFVEKTDPELDKLLSKSVAVDDMKPGLDYLIIHPGNGDCAVPVHIEESIKIGDESGFKISRTYIPKFHYEPVQDDAYHQGGYDSYAAPNGASIENLKVGRRNSKPFVVGGSSLIVSESCRAVEVDPAAGQGGNAFIPADNVDVDEALFKSGVHKVAGEKREDGSYLFRVDGFVDSSTLPEHGAVLRLMGGCHFKEADARDFLKIVDAEQAGSLLFKVADGSRQIQIGNIPDFYQTFDNEINANVENPQHFVVPIMNTTPPPPVARIGDKYDEVHDLSGMGPQQLAQFAAMTQSKQIFDHGLVGQLAKTYSTEAVMKGYLDKLMTALDVMGRIIFLYYWKNDEFVSAYGSDDQPELEAKLLDNFKSMGTLILDLKEKSITSQEGTNQTV